MRITIKLLQDSGLDIYKVIDILIAIANIAVIVYIFTKDNRRYKKEYEATVKQYWIRKVILEENYDKIMKFYDDNLKILKKSDKSAKKRIDMLSRINYEFYTGVCNIIEIIDSELEKKIRISTEDLRDELTIAITSGETSEAINKIHESKREVIAHIYCMDKGNSPYVK